MKQYMPREKLKRFGAENLSDVELLRILIGSGNQQSSAEKNAKHLLKLLQERGDRVTYQEVSAIPGMGPAKTCEIIALFELGRRYLIPADRPVVKSAEDAFALLDNIKTGLYRLVAEDDANSHTPTATRRGLCFHL